MPQPLYHQDSYITEFEAMVTESLDNGVILDQSAFYPGGGGQPSDIGILRVGDTDHFVTKIRRMSGNIIHEIDGLPPPVGTRVKGVIDWEHRYQLMRTHTALHILCGIVWKDYGAQVTGGDMQPLHARMDFELANMTAEFAHEMEGKANQEVIAARPVSTRVLVREEAMQIPDLIRTKINLLPQGITEVRVVDIEGLDLQADGGTHVANTREVGLILVVGHESKGRLNKRLRIKVQDL
jgi:misacylated tRNA(Ala) deacylase